LIAQNILDSGTIAGDWLPFEPIKVNYPLGTHFLLAETARFTGLPVHVVFKDVGDRQWVSEVGERLGVRAV
jgi:hypothetical protein